MEKKFDAQKFMLARWLSNRFMPRTNLETIMYFYNKLMADEFNRKE